MRKSILSIRDLYVGYRVYGGKLKVLNGINLDIYPKEKIGLVGESGCGKTTTMRAILRVLPRQGFVSQGEVILQDKDVFSMNNVELQRLRSTSVSMIFQDPTASLNPVFIVGEQIKDIIKCSKVIREGKGEKQKIEALALKTLGECGLADPDRIMKSYPFQLSGGMRQRICIAMALATTSKLLIADEPTTNLDATIQAQVLDLIKNLVEEKSTSLILITHSLGVAREMSDRIFVMYGGNIVEVAPTDVFFKNPCHPYSQGLLKSIPKLSGIGSMEGIPGRMVDYLNPPKGCRFSPRCKNALSICYQKTPSIMEVEKGHYVACYMYKKQKTDKDVVRFE